MKTSTKRVILAIVTAWILFASVSALSAAADRKAYAQPQAAVDEFAGQFSGTQMRTALTKAYQKADVPEGEVLAGAVVGVSCQAPSEVNVEQTKSGVEITADPVKTKNQCIVPVTTVALVSVPEAAV